MPRGDDSTETVIHRPYGASLLSRGFSGSRGISADGVLVFV
jgi:hypothetical protein